MNIVLQTEDARLVKGQQKFSKSKFVRGITFAKAAKKVLGLPGISNTMKTV